MTYLDSDRTGLDNVYLTLKTSPYRLHTFRHHVAKIVATTVTVQAELMSVFAKSDHVDLSRLLA